MNKLFKKLITFLKEVQIEIKKINWPKREETLRYTLIVIGISLATAAFLGGLDIIFQFFLEKFIF